MVERGEQAEAVAAGERAALTLTGAATGCDWDDSYRLNPRATLGDLLPQMFHTDSTTVDGQGLLAPAVEALGDEALILEAAIENLEGAAPIVRRYADRMGSRAHFALELNRRIARANKTEVHP
ncbi:MAG: hypothetical protein JW751_22670 [Polyangiaceae bacterium]|nr:hypothetical protein [Polyangiaceae bacterium]